MFRPFYMYRNSIFCARRAVFLLYLPPEKITISNRSSRQNSSKNYASFFAFVYFHILTVFRLYLAGADEPLRPSAPHLFAVSVFSLGILFLTGCSFCRACVFLPSEDCRPPARPAVRQPPSTALAL